MAKYKTVIDFTVYEASLDAHPTFGNLDQGSYFHVVGHLDEADKLANLYQRVGSASDYNAVHVPSGGLMVMSATVLVAPIFEIEIGVRKVWGR